MPDSSLGRPITEFLWFGCLFFFTCFVIPEVLGLIKKEKSLRNVYKKLLVVTHTNFTVYLPELAQDVFESHLSPYLFDVNFVGKASITHYATFILFFFFFWYSYL